MMRLHFFLATFFLVILLVTVQGRLNSASDVIPRSLQGDNNQEEGNPSEWFGGDAPNATETEEENNAGGGNGGGGGGGNGGHNNGGGKHHGKNQTEETAPQETDAPVVTEAPVENVAENNATAAEQPVPEETTKETEAPKETPAPTEQAAPSESESPEGGEAENPEGGEGGGGAGEGEGDDMVGEDDDGMGDDMVGDDLVEEEQAEEWFDEEENQEEGTKAPYVPPTGDDPFATQPDESEWSGQEEWKQETPEEMMHDKNVLVALVCAVVIGMVLALCSAQQVIENPNGCCAAICRCVVKVICFPCKLCCSGKNRNKHDLMQAGSDSYTHDLELT